MVIQIEDETFDSDEEVAVEQQVTTRTLARWRSLGEGPPFIKRGRRIFYRRRSRKAWFASREQGAV